MKIQTYFISAALPAVFGLVFGELLMVRMFKLFQPCLGGMTFLTVEVVGAFLIDFPLAFLSAIILTKIQPHAGPRHAILTGAAFVITFSLFIGMAIAIHQFTSALDVFGLHEAFSIAVRTAREEVGNILSVMILTFLAFEFLLCMTAGLIGHILVAGKLRTGTETATSEPG